jgi:hypothetical protein
LNLHSAAAGELSDLQRTLDELEVAASASSRRQDEEEDDNDEEEEEDKGDEEVGDSKDGEEPTHTLKEIDKVIKELSSSSDEVSLFSDSGTNICFVPLCCLIVPVHLLSFSLSLSVVKVERAKRSAELPPELRMPPPAKGILLPDSERGRRSHQYCLPPSTYSIFFHLFFFDR